MVRNLKPVVLAVLLIILIAVAGYASRQKPSTTSSNGNDTTQTQEPSREEEKPVEWKTEVLATKLEIPWDLAILPDQSLLITERTGRLKRYVNGQVELVGTLPVAAVSESGLTGIALHPQFQENQLLYLYYTYRTGGELKNKVVRYRYADSQLTEDRVILDGLAGGQIHNGGRLRFGPDDKLYVLTGDAARPSLAQDLNRLEGKVLRLNDDGTVPTDNPTAGSKIYSSGHRNPQGLSWHTLTEELLVTEHGETANDEVNLIAPNGNYGWPAANKGSQGHQNYVAPILDSGSVTWAPSGLDFLGKEIWSLRNTAVFAGLRSKQLFSFELLDGQVKNLKVILDGQFGRLRAVVARGDGAFYLTTSNRDGRAQPGQDDDRLILVSPVVAQ